MAEAGQRRRTSRGCGSGSPSRPTCTASTKKKPYMKKTPDAGTPRVGVGDYGLPGDEAGYLFMRNDLRLVDKFGCRVGDIERTGLVPICGLSPGIPRNHLDINGDKVDTYPSKCPASPRMRRLFPIGHSWGRRTFSRRQFSP
jgi:hypothetical protein